MWTKKHVYIFFIIKLQVSQYDKKKKRTKQVSDKRRKMKSIKAVFNGESLVQVAKKYELSGRMLRNWIIKYNKNGESSLENKKKLRNQP